MYTKRIWPLNNEARASTDDVLFGEDEQRGGALSPRRIRAPHPISCAHPRLLLLHRLSRRLLCCGQPEKKNYVSNNISLAISQYFENFRKKPVLTNVQTENH